MGAMNRVFLMGNLTRDPQLRKTPSGMAVSDIGLAVSENFRNKAGDLVETKCFVDVVAWDRQAEVCSQYLSKGAPVIVEGRLQLDQWQTEAGEKRSRLRVRAERIQFLRRAGAGEEEEANGLTAAHDQEDRSTLPGEVSF